MVHVEVFKVLVLDRLGSVSSTIQFLRFGGKAVEVSKVLSLLVGLLTDHVTVVGWGKMQDSLVLYRALFCWEY